MRDAFVKQLCHIAEIDSDLMLLTADLGFGVLDEFRERFPDQFINVGVAEQNMAGIAAGLALEGCTVYAYSIANFTTLRCLEQIRNDICYHDANVTLVSVGAGFSYGQLGVSHFATEDLAILRALPNLTVVVPSDPWEAAQLAPQLHETQGPKFLRIDKSAAGIMPSDEAVKLGVGRVLVDGEDVAIIGVGGVLSEAIKASASLSHAGVSARVIALNTIKPFDHEIIKNACQETRRLVVLEEHVSSGGLHGAISEYLLEQGLYPDLYLPLNIGDEYPTIVGDQNFLRRHYKLDASSIFERVLAALNSSN